MFSEKKLNWQLMLIMLVTLTVGSFLWALRPLIRHVFEPQNDITMIVPIGLAAMTGIVWRIKRFDETGR